jgi:hypothetical protein
MYLRGDLTERAVAAILECSPSYIHKLKEQAIELLRRCLERRGIRETAPRSRRRQTEGNDEPT